MNNRHSSTLSSLRYALRLARMPLTMRTARAASTQCPLPTAGRLNVLSPRYLTESFFRCSPTYTGSGCHPADDIRRSSPSRGLPGIVWSQGLRVSGACSIVEAVSGCPQAFVHAIRRVGRIVWRARSTFGPGWKICVAKLAEFDYIRTTDQGFSVATQFALVSPGGFTVRPGHNFSRALQEQLQGKDCVRAVSHHG